MRIIDLPQGSDLWHEHRRVHWNASDAPAMMGVSSHETRNDFLHRVYCQRNGLPVPPVSEFQQRLFDDGHRAERLARPGAEGIFGEDLYPLVTANGKLSSSLDGRVADASRHWEHKLMREELRALLPREEVGDETVGAALPLEHRIQMAQQHYTSGSVRALFTASEWSEDGRLIDARHCWCKRDDALIADVLAGWEQFERDLAAYVPPERVEPVRPVAIETLPTPAVQVTGSLAVRDNLALFGEALHAFIKKIPQQPSSDQEFAHAESACKSLKKAEEALEAAENLALGSLGDVDAMRRVVSELRGAARNARLASEKLVQRRKDQIREEEVQRGISSLQALARELNASLGGAYIAAPNGQPFSDAIKGLKTIDSLRNAIDTTAARESIALRQSAERVRANLATIDGAASPALFADRATLVHKDPEAVTAIVAQRVAEHRAAEERRLEAERERIRDEERARAEANAAITRASAPALAIVADAGRAGEELAGPPSLKLGTICNRLDDRGGFLLRQAFLDDVLKVPPAGRDGRGVLYRESQWPTIKARLIDYIKGLA